MNIHQVARRLQAFAVGKPLPHGETIHFPIAKNPDILILAFVRMGGESAPWAIGLSRPGGQARILTVPEARNRDLVADMVAEFAPRLLSHLRHPDHTRDTVEGEKHKKPIRQVWLPNKSHLDMLHHLAYSYTFTKWGDPARAKLLNQLGRACNWLFREAQRPGQATVVVATEALRESFTFPAEDLRQAHLGFLLAWLAEQGNRETRMKAAALQERRPIATTLDPAVEREELGPQVGNWNEAHQRDDQRLMDRLTRRIRETLEPEVLRRLDLTEQTINVLRTDKRRANSGLALLEEASRSEHWFQYLRVEQHLSDDRDGPAFIPSPETDRHASAAASRFFVHEESEEIRYNALIHDDPDVQEDAIAEGEAFQGRITQIQDLGSGKKTVPVWTLEGSDTTPLRLREGSHVCVAGIPKRSGEVVSIEPAGEGHRRYEVVIHGWKTQNFLPDGTTVPHACDRSLRGKTVVFLPDTAAGLARLKSQRVWKRDVPGAWLTHTSPRGPSADLPAEVAENLTEIAGFLGNE